MKKIRLSKLTKKPAVRKIRSFILKPVTKGGFIREFFLGFKYLGRGAKAVFSFREDLWVWALLPVVISLFVYIATFVIIVLKLDDLLKLFLPSVDESAFWKAIMVVLWIVVMAGIIIAGYFLFVPLMTLIAAPLNEVLSEKVEVLLLNKKPPPFIFKVFIKELARTISQEIVKLILYAIFMIPLLIVSLLIPVAGPVILFIIGGFITSIYFAYDQLDRSFSRHVMPIHQRINFVKKFFFRTLGFGTAGFFLLLIPGAIFLVVPAAVAGATLIYLESDEDRLRAIQEAQKPDKNYVPYSP